MVNKGSVMKRLQPVIIAYQVSWSLDIVYADVVIEQDDANVNIYGHYDFSNTSAMGCKHEYLMATNGMFLYSIKEDIR